MPHLCRVLRVLFFLAAGYTCFVSYGYLKACCPAKPSMPEDFSEKWEGRVADSIVLEEGQGFSDMSSFWEHPCDVSFTFRLEQGGSFLVKMGCVTVSVTESEIRNGSVCCRGEFAKSPHRLGLSESGLVLDGHVFDALQYGTGHKGFDIINTGKGALTLSEFWAEKLLNPASRQKSLGIRSAPRTKEELLHRTLIWVRYFVYSEAPPPLLIRCRDK